MECMKEGCQKIISPKRGPQALYCSLECRSRRGNAFGRPRGETLAEQQENLCFYCGMEFGEVLVCKGDPIILRPEVEHLVPRAYHGKRKGVKPSSGDRNDVVAACQVCNNVKGGRFFSSFGEAQAFIRAGTWKKGYRLP